ncbi:hypothetical protein MOQ72_33620 [Saccharopolyspora sp. K220]|uniref:hypothetical protein n=1 Tax=Saccharopolyspora soli TaxID=2926618 RepID=UPI001F579A5F|nr:hypothetical protein [Saccharopolyspora soli]MCI2422378.1 hypothetical protein [Saccharopolyspora soli]
MTLDIVDAAELAELLEFLGDWLESDGDRLAESFRRFVGGPGYDTAKLREDLSRFRFLLGGGDGEGVFKRNPE